ncbi:MAG TPA: thioredoxin family protein [Methanotrichaceae archaeon]|nr:thioredoxin family protein [Methanotrichaceae archaeon]
MSASLWIAALSLTALILAASAEDGVSGYEPAHALGLGKGDWWIRYPDQNVDADKSVGHPLWVLNALKSGPVLILDHTKYCRPCVKLQADVKKVMANISSIMTYYDLDAEGSDRRAQDILDIYSPTGTSENRVPLMVVLTLIRDGNGQVRVAWHSNSGLPVDSHGNDLGEVAVNSYLQDAIYYHSQNTDAAQENPALFSGVQESLRMEQLKGSTQQNLSSHG